MKTGLVYSFQESSWFSVNKIVSNLLKSYEMALGKESIVPINYSMNLTDAENKASVKAGMGEAIKRLVILDHRPHPRGIFEWIGQEKLQQLEEIVVHIFGDFTLNFAEWRASEKLLKGTRLRFLCASPKQASLIQKFAGQRAIISVCPFPVDSDHFFYDSKKREKFRRERGLSESDFVFLYVGRMSLQKNVQETIKAFLELKQSGGLGPRHKFWLAGEFDVIGNPYVEDRHVLGEYFRKIQRSLEGYSEDLKKDVKFLGSVPNDELCDFYNGCDRFLSLSSYQDEDYGMAVAEASVCGLPSALTDWAGYSSFKCDSVPNFTNYMKVELGIHRALINSDLAKKLILSSASHMEMESRSNASSWYKEKLTLQAVAGLLKETSKERPEVFKGFSELLKRLGAVAAYKKAPYMNEMNKTLNEFYYKVYDVYAE